MDSIAKIDIASTEQAAALEQIKQGLNQISAVVQTNAATAEENSATSEEMSAQAATLHEEVRKFKLRNQEFGNSLFQPAKESYQDPFSDSASQFDLSSFGKY